MLNCWRQDPHRRPNFDRVLYAVKKEAESLSSAAPTLSPPTKPACIQRELSGSPAPVQRTMRLSNTPMMSKQTSGSASTSVEDASTLPRVSRHDSAPSQNAAPTLAKNASHERRTVRGSDRKEPSLPHATATVTEAVPQRNSTTSGAVVGQKPSRFTSKTTTEELADLWSFAAESRPRNRDMRSGSGQARPGGSEAVGGGGGEHSEGAGAGREGGGVGRVLSKKRQKAQVVHGFRLITTAGDGGQASAGGEASYAVRGKEKRGAP